MNITRKKAIVATISVLTALIVIAAVVVPVALYAAGVIDYAEKAENGEGKYLMVYFTGNDPEQERICFAVSEDGYDFTPLNGNNPVLEQTLGTKIARDPYIFRGHDGG